MQSTRYTLWVLVAQSTASYTLGARTYTAINHGNGETRRRRTHNASSAETATTPLAAAAAAATTGVAAVAGTAQQYMRMLLQLVVGCKEWPAVYIGVAGGSAYHGGMICTLSIGLRELHT